MENLASEGTGKALAMAKNSF